MILQRRRTLLVLTTLSIALLGVAETGLAQRGHGPGRGFGRGGGMRPDMTVIHTMFEHRDKIERKVKMLPDGAEAITESDDDKVASLLQEHVPAVEERVLENKPLPPMTFHPVFVELIKHADEYTLEHEATDRGVKVRYKADNPYAVMLVQEHAKLVSRFIKNGMTEIHADYKLPKVATTSLANTQTKPKYIHPQIRKYGKVVQFPTAAQQPRDGSKIVVDITKGGDPEKLNGAIEKVARFVNIYAGAGEKPANVKIAVVLHGDTTLAALNDAAYAKKFDTDSNPNLPCIEVLRKAGVEFFVCGQSLVSKGGRPEQVDDDVSVAVSALTSLVNLQADGYSFLPMLK